MNYQQELDKWGLKALNVHCLLSYLWTDLDPQLLFQHLDVFLGEPQKNVLQARIKLNSDW